MACCRGRKKAGDKTPRHRRKVRKPPAKPVRTSCPNCKWTARRLKDRNGTYGACNRCKTAMEKQ